MNSKTNNLFESYNINLNEEEIKESIETGNSVFELKFDCSNEDNFGVGNSMATPLYNVLTDVATKVANGKFEGPIMDVNGNKIGSFGIGYEGVETGLSEKEELNEEDKSIYDYTEEDVEKMNLDEMINLYSKICIETDMDVVNLLRFLNNSGCLNTGSFRNMLEETIEYLHFGDNN